MASQNGQESIPESWEESGPGQAGSGDSVSQVSKTFSSLNVEAPAFVPGQNVFAPVFVPSTPQDGNDNTTGDFAIRLLRLCF